MKVYHSSYMIVDKPDVLHSREALDFGKGFYVTCFMSRLFVMLSASNLEGERHILTFTN